MLKKNTLSTKTFETRASAQWGTDIPGQRHFLMYIKNIKSMKYRSLWPTFSMRSNWSYSFIYPKLSCNLEGTRQNYWIMKYMLKRHTFIIGIKHGFPCINVCQVPREMLKTEAVGRGFQHLPRDLANVNVLENNV